MAFYDSSKTTVKRTNFHSSIPLWHRYNRDPYFILDDGFHGSSQFALPGSQAATLPPQMVTGNQTTTSHQTVPRCSPVASSITPRIAPAGRTRTTGHFILPGSAASTRPPVVSSFLCSSCTKTFSDFESMVFHMFHDHVHDRKTARVISTTRITPYPQNKPNTERNTGKSQVCDMCTVWFTSERLLRRHLQKTHHMHITTR